MVAILNNFGYQLCNLALRPNNFKWFGEVVLEEGCKILGFEGEVEVDAVLWELAFIDDRLDDWAKGLGILFFLQDWLEDCLGDEDADCVEFPIWFDYVFKIFVLFWLFLDFGIQIANGLFGDFRVNFEKEQQCLTAKFC